MGRSGLWAVRIMGSEFEVDGDGWRRRHPDKFLSPEGADGGAQEMRPIFDD